MGGPGCPTDRCAHVGAHHLRDGQPVAALRVLQSGPIPILDKAKYDGDFEPSPFGLADSPTAPMSDITIANARLAGAWQLLYAVAALRTANEHPLDVIRFLRALAGKRPDDPAVLIALAEAQSEWHETAADALDALTILESKDLLTSAESARALARLRAARGDVAGRDRALDRCRKLTRTADRCRLETAARRG